MAVLPFDAFLPDLINLVTYPTEDKYKHSGYRKACDHAEDMAVHLYGDIPTKLLKRVRPREDEAITSYRLESYEPTTMSTAGKALSITKKIFNPKLYAIHPAKNDDGQKLYEYATITYPIFNSVVNFLSEYGLKKTLADPNGVFLVEPELIPYIEIDGVTQVDRTKTIIPVVTCFPSKNVHLITRDYAFLFVKKDENEKGDPEFYYKYVDFKVVIEFYLTSSNMKEWFTFVVSSYVHDCGSLPVWFLGGEYDQHNIGLFQSFFYPAVPFWNKAVNAESDLDGAFIAHLHPQKWEVAEECEFVEGEKYACDRGWIFNVEKNQRYKCHSCGGTGRKSVKGPYSTYQVSRDKLSDPSGATLNQPPADYINVPTAATEMLVTRCETLMEKGLSALGMDVVNKIGENQSGVSKAYDRTELFDFLGKVRDLFYDKHLVNIFYYFAKYMFIGKSDEQLAEIEPTIIKPNDFDIFTAQDLTDQLKVAKESNLNPGYLQVKQIEIQNKEFQSNPDQLQFLNLCVDLDPYAEISRTDLDLMIYSGTISTENAIIHDNIREFVRRALDENEKFKDLEYLEQMVILNKYATDVMDKIEEQKKVELDQAAIEGQPAPNDAE